MTFEDWLTHEGHMHTFVHVILQEIDNENPPYTDAVQLAVNEARRREIRRLKTWRPKDPQEVPQIRDSARKAGEYFKNGK